MKTIVAGFPFNYMTLLLVFDWIRSRLLVLSYATPSLAWRVTAASVVIVRGKLHFTPKIIIGMFFFFFLFLKIQ